MHNHQILAIKQSDPTAETTALEQQIDNCKDAINRFSTNNL